MTKTIPFSYEGCHGCKERSECGQCATRLEEAIMGLTGINGASIQLSEKQLTVDGNISESRLLKSLENLGIISA